MLQHTLSRMLVLLWHMPHVFLMGVASAGYAAVRRWWVQRRQRLLSEESRDWPTHRGRVVAVQAVRDGNEEKKGSWAGLLTYSYILDEVEIGEYRQPFKSEAEADDWVRAMRGEVVTVAVDPKDQRRSIWIAKEAEETRKAAEIAWMEAETKQLPVWLEIARMATFAGAVAGAFASVVVEIQQLKMIYAHAAAMKHYGPWWMRAGVPLCAGIAAYIFTRRFPGTRMEDVGKRFKDPAISLFGRVLGIVEGAALTGLCWEWEWGVGSDAVKATIWNASLPFVCGGLFAGAALALWVAGPNLPVQPELTPESVRRL